MCCVWCVRWSAATSVLRCSHLNRALVEMKVSMDIIEENNKIIKGFLQEFNDKYLSHKDLEITDWDLIKEIVSFFIDGHAESNVLDFIDISNWDSIESFTFDDEKRTLNLVWHNFLDSENEFEIQAFGAHLLTCEVKVASILLTLNKGLPVLLIKGLYQDPKVIQRTYNNGCSKMDTFICHPFSVEIVKVVKRKLHSIVVPNIYCYTMALLPNYMNYISAVESKDHLFSENIKLICLRVTKLMKDLDSVEESDQERLCQIGNTTRIHFENGLKVLFLKARTHFDDSIPALEGDYQKAMLGDLTRAIKNTDFAGQMNLKLQDVVTLLNTCSHDSGTYIKKEDIVKAQMFVIAALNFN